MCEKCNFASSVSLLQRMRSLAGAGKRIFVISVGKEVHSVSSNVLRGSGDFNFTILESDQVVGDAGSSARSASGSEEWDPLAKAAYDALVASTQELAAVNAHEQPVRRSVVMNVLALFLPGSERDGWLEENRSYLTNIDGAVRRALWVGGWVRAMPRYAYTVRADVKKESA